MDGIGKTQGMTGVGFAAGASEVGEVRIEVRSVNGRGLSCKVRAPFACSGFEAAIEEAVRAQVQRGTVAVVVERVQAPSPLPNAEALRDLAAGLRELAGSLQLPPPSLQDVLQVALAASRHEAMTSRPLPAQLRGLLDKALRELVQRREADGHGAAAAIAANLDEYATLAANAAARAPALVDAYRERLLQRVRDFVAANLPSAPPAADVVREVALFADRVDVAEEVQRARAHVGEIAELLRRGGEIGRRLEFLLQELLRETNTLGAKSPDATIAHAVVAMKAAIERMKEQAANLQ
jgi:uncharacterized protein (TIGR00255 family)